MPFVPTGWASRSSRGPSLDSSKDKSSILSWARALLQSSPSSQRPLRRPRLSTGSPLRGSSHEVCSPSASPRTLQQHDEPGLPHPTHLRPQVFSTSRRLHPPRACRPCFMPDPLVGLHPPELSPPAQPYAVSDAVPLLSLGDPGLHAHRRAPKCAPTCRLRWPPPPTGVCSTRESASAHRRFRPMTSA
jgi:hypothetical protein